MGKPRLLFVSNLFPDRAEPYRGLDNATVLHHLSDTFEIRAISPRPTLWRSPVRLPRAIDEPFEPIYVPARYIPKFGGFNHLLMARALWGPLQTLRSRWPFDVVLSSWIFPDSCAVARLARDFPFVSIAQGTDVHQYLKIPARRRAIITEMGRASAIITRSAALARLLEDAGLPGDRLHPVYNGIAFDQFQLADKAEARKSLGLPEADALVLFVGNLLPIKNPLLLLRVIARLEGVRLVMVGGGPMEAQARALATELGIAKRVVFAGRRAASEVARFMQAADVLALPSLNEGVPNVILEAFASGLRVVASDVGGISEVHHGQFLGELVPSGDLDSLVAALRQTLGTPPKCAEIRKHALQFSWESAATQYANLLTAAIR